MALCLRIILLNEASNVPFSNIYLTTCQTSPTFSQIHNNPIDNRTTLECYKTTDILTPVPLTPSPEPMEKPNVQEFNV